MIKFTPKRIILSLIVVILITIAIIATSFAASYWNYLMSVFGTSNSEVDSVTVSNAAALGDDLVQEIAEDSIVMLKNENNVLPLSEDNRKINLFGYASTRKGFIYSGYGSSGTIINKDPASDEVLEKLVVSPVQAFEREGFEVNKELEKFYTDFSDYDATGKGITDLHQPDYSAYNRNMLVEAMKFSDTAVVFISRKGSESYDIPLVQNKYNGKNITDDTRTYLQFTEEEEQMIELVVDNFDKVIVVLNTGNPIEAGLLNDKGIDAVLQVGFPGQSGTLAIPRLLKGYKIIEKEDGTQEKIAVTPSGRLADTYSYFTRKYNPTDANMFAQPHFYTGHGQISYTEGIYVGYRWYETADAEGYFDDVSNEYGKGYDGVVQYPFGYGLSYGTDFDYEVKTSLPVGSEITANTEITVTVKVTNSPNATATGKDVVQLYYTPPYYEGEIEKAEVNLLAFAKTAPLAPGLSQELTFNIKPYDLACYDDYGKNPGDHTGYELDRGKYVISLRSDAHNVIDCANSELEYNVSETINIDIDPVTENTVENRFTGADAYMGMPIDGSTAGGDPIKYLSRANFEGTFPNNRTPDRSDSSAINQVNTALNDKYDTNVMPNTGQNNGHYLVVKEDGTKASLADLQGKTDAKFKYNDELILALGKDYEEPRWEKLLDQLSVKEMTDVVANGFFGTMAIESVGKPQRLDIDGPAGFHYSGANDELRGKYVAFPSESLIGCSWNQQTAYNMGQAQGVIANATNVNGWYAPGLNLHRNPYSGRYFEYYSEDPLVIGKLATEVIRGSTNNGLYCYMKHFAVSEEGINPDNVKTWLTEQTLREIYLRPFEIATKEGEANAVMTAFNCIGAVWAAACDPMNNDILRTEWGFRGSLITDWALGDRSWMSGKLGIRGGNDLWLDQNEPFDKDATTVNLLRNATKNILYTVSNTYARAKAYQESGSQDDRYKVDLTVEVAESPFSPVPILMVLGIWVLALAASAVCVVFIIKKPKTAPCNDTGGGDRPGKMPPDLPSEGDSSGDNERAPDPDGPKNTSHETESFAEKFAALAWAEKRRYNEFTKYVLLNPRVTMVSNKYCVIFKYKKEKIFRIVIRNSVPVVLFKLVNAELKKFMEDGDVKNIKVRTVDIRLSSDEALNSAKQLADLAAKNSEGN